MHSAVKPFCCTAQKMGARRPASKCGSDFSWRRDAGQLIHIACNSISADLLPVAGCIRVTAVSSVQRSHRRRHSQTMKEDREQRDQTDNGPEPLAFNS